MPRKFRFSVLLPIVQVIITAVLTLWADRVDWMLLALSNRAPGPYVHVHLFVIEARLIWRGINAPTFPLCTAGQSNRQVLGFGVGEILYLAAVAVLWYLVGRFLDRRRHSKVTEGQGTMTPRTMPHFLVMAWGMFLLVESLWTFHDEISFAHSYFLRIDGIIVATLFLVWSLILLIFPGWRLASRIHREVDSDSTV